ncbi:MAG TPA: hypothetical protein VFO18_19505 [Methylomirabilota bacterium]|nr:hypothetical protein [Methylomirabilota bacterium]
MNERYSDEELGRLLRERLPRYPASASLRAAVVQTVLPDAPRRRSWTLWLAPAASSLATAMIAILWIVPFLTVNSTADPLQLVSRAVVSEHAKNVLWGESRSDVVPAVLPRAMEESGVAMDWVFTGDEDIQLVNAKPTFLEGHRGIELAYEDTRGHTVTYVILPAGKVVLPERGRVQIDRWRPLVRTENGFSLIVWRQGGLLCVMVSDLVSENDLNTFKQYFVKVRSSTEPYAVY